VRDAVVFPDILVELIFNDDRCVKALADLRNGDQFIVVTSKDLNAERPSKSDFFNVGVIGRLKQGNFETATAKVLFESEKRIKITKYTQIDPYFKVEIQKIDDDMAEDARTIALKNTLISDIRDVLTKDRGLSFDVILKVLSLTEPNQIINNIVPVIQGSIDQKQMILESVDLNDRLELTLKMVSKALKVTELEEKVMKETQEELSKSQKEVFLREELKTIQKELGDGGLNEYELLRKKINEAKMPKEAEEIALKELDRLQKTPSFSPEVSLMRNYLDWLITMPWSKYREGSIDLHEAKKVLDEDHYGLDKVKERILEFLAIQKISGKTKGPILCFVGPPGTGKTSIGKSIAKSLSRQFTRISLGGIRDEAEIRGHRRTYVGAMPGRIVQSIHQTQSRNPVFMLDEIDKLGVDFRGDPSAALLEALDPEQNNNFSDHYLEVPFDLSDVMFITTANTLDGIPAPLRDRMEIIEFPGYLPEEKFQIAKMFIWPKVLKASGITKTYGNFLTDEALKEIIDNYTWEAGVRNLERQLSKIGRKLAYLIAMGDSVPKTVDTDELAYYLGQPTKEVWSKENKDEIGLVAGLAVTEGGGEILSIEASVIPQGDGKLLLTGHLGEVMKESGHAAMTYARRRAEKLGIEPEVLKKSDVHVHVPSGAIPKDGPSAGIAIAGAIISAFLNKPINSDVGMTGEITLRGRVLRIGGVREKILAAKRLGLKKVILPKANLPDLAEIQESYKTGLDIHAVDNMDDILPLIFEKES